MELWRCVAQTTFYRQENRCLKCANDQPKALLMGPAPAILMLAYWSTLAELRRVVVCEMGAKSR